MRREEVYLGGLRTEVENSALVATPDNPTVWIWVSLLSRAQPGPNHQTPPIRAQNRPDFNPDKPRAGYSY